MPGPVEFVFMGLLLQVRVARDKPLLRAAGKHAAAIAAAAAAAAAADAAPAGAATGVGSDGRPVMLGVAAVAGVHHFSGSWLGLDGSKSLSLRKEVSQLHMRKCNLLASPCNHTMYRGERLKQHGSWLGLDGSKSLSLKKGVRQFEFSAACSHWVLVLLFISGTLACKKPQL
jgi:hypothetical protein